MTGSAARTWDCRTNVNALPVIGSIRLLSRPSAAQTAAEKLPSIALEISLQPGSRQRSARLRWRARQLPALCKCGDLQLPGCMRKPPWLRTSQWRHPRPL